jgi:hypothetical protein
MIKDDIKEFALAIDDLYQRAGDLARYCRDNPHVLKSGDPQTAYVVFEELPELRIAANELRNAVNRASASISMMGKRLRALAEHGFDGDDPPAFELVNAVVNAYARAMGIIQKH